MAGDTVPHVQSSGLIDSFHSFHRSVTGLAFDAFEHVRLVAEIDKVRHIVYSNPLEGMTGLIFLPKFDDVSLAGGHHVMTAHADIHGRNCGMRRAFGIGVAVEDRKERR